jgi:Putative Actinobacterial Holin-X, holin superfamily III
MTEDASTGELVSRLSQDVSVLIRDELRLAQAEVSAKAKKTGVGVGLLGTAGIIALYGVAALIATAILALALVLDAWLAALIVGLVLLAVAGIAAVLGKKRVSEAGPPVPTAAVDSVKQDVAALKEGAHR